MANIEGQAEEGVSDTMMQLRPSRHRIDKHARFRLERKADLPALRMFAQFPATGNEAIHQHLFARRFHRRARPEANGLGTQRAGYVHGPAQEIETTLPLFLLGAKQGRLMFTPRIEEKPSAGFNND